MSRVISFGPPPYILARPVPHRWSHITDLPGDWSALTDPQVHGLVQVWLEQQDELRSRGSLDVFLSKLMRQWAVETGALEDVYQITEGATKTLIEKGLDAALISHVDVDEDPATVENTNITEGKTTRVVEKIIDQHQAIAGLYQFIASERRLTKSYMCELHQVLTAHQEFYRARDTLGNYVTRRLPRGEFKQFPNNVEGPDSFIFEFCPPEQVESEIDNLLEMHERHMQLGVPPEVEAAWLHHRFVLIHPFVDGNGRMARCLSTMVLLKACWLPLVVTRADKPEYIGALRQADAGDLRPLIRLFSELQRKAIRQSLSLGHETMMEATRLQGVLASIRSKFEKRAEELGELQQRALTTTDSLHALAWKRMQDASNQVMPLMQVASDLFKAYAMQASRGSENAHYNNYQIVQCARQMNYFADLEAYRSWVALALITEIKTEILLSFHGIGRGKSGVFGCAAMTYVRRTDEDGPAVIDKVTPLAEEPFEFAYAEDPINVRARFGQWLEVVLSQALARWADDVG